MRFQRDTSRAAVICLRGRSGRLAKVIIGATEGRRFCASPSAQRPRGQSHRHQH
jgi:hypothetical protein